MAKRQKKTTAPKVEVCEIEIVYLPKPTLWQRIKSWFRG